MLFWLAGWRRCEKNSWLSPKRVRSLGFIVRVVGMMDRVRRKAIVVILRGYKVKSTAEQRFVGEAYQPKIGIGT